MSENKKISKLWLILVVAVFIISVSCVCGTENLSIPDLFGDKDDGDTSDESTAQVDNALLKDDFSDSNSGWKADLLRPEMSVTKTEFILSPLLKKMP